MKYLLLLVFTTALWAQVSGIKDFIKDPSLSFRCKALLTQRDSKVKLKQKLEALYKRTKSLWKKTPSQKQSIRKRLKLSGSQINNQIRLQNLRVRNMEEDIIRKGCPGITL